MAMNLKSLGYLSIYRLAIKNRLENNQQKKLTSCNAETILGKDQSPSGESIYLKIKK